MANPYSLEELQKMAQMGAPGSSPLRMPPAMSAPAAPATGLASDAAVPGLQAAGSVIGGTPGAAVTGAAGGLALAKLLGTSNPGGAAIGAGLALVSSLFKNAAERRAAIANATAKNAGADANDQELAARGRSATLRSIIR